MDFNKFKRYGLTLIMIVLCFFDSKAQLSQINLLEIARPFNGRSGVIVLRMSDSVYFTFLSKDYFNIFSNFSIDNVDSDYKYIYQNLKKFEDSISQKKITEISNILIVENNIEYNIFPSNGTLVELFLKHKIKVFYLQSVTGNVVLLKIKQKKRKGRLFVLNDEKQIIFDYIYKVGRKTHGEYFGKH